MSDAGAARWIPKAGGLLPLLSVVFVVSGAAGLFYESVWARYLGLFVGHSAYAQILVLTIFLGGMALGAVLAGSRSASLRDPLRWYAFAELAAGAIGIVFHDVYRLVTGFAYDAIFPAIEGSALLTVTKWVIAGLLILPQSVLLGTTFPLMAAGVMRRLASRPGHVLGVLYFANSLGAAVGVLVAGFYLLSLSGLPGTLLVAAMLNLLAALVVFLAARAAPAGDARDTTEVPEPAPPSGELATFGSVDLWRLLLAVSFGTAVASFIYEIAWLRMLAQVLGSATHSFELMLSAFILGLALGAWWVRSRADRWTRPLRALGLVQWIMGAAALATLPLYAAAFDWMWELNQAFARTEVGYRWFTVAKYGLCLAVMLPPTFCAGITLPLITRTLVRSGGGERAIGSVYGVNTFGSILGVMLAGLVLMPVIGLRLLLVSGAALDMLLGVAILWLLWRRAAATARLAYGSLTAAAVLTVGLAAGVRWDQRVVSGGIFRGGRVSPESREILFYQDGRTASVSVARGLGDSAIAIATNGKTDGSLRAWWLTPCTDSTLRRPVSGDLATQVIAPLLALAHAPRAQTAVLIGHGTGMSGHVLLGNPALRTVTTIEIEPEMIRGSRWFFPSNRRFFEDPRSQLVIEDARAQLAAEGKQYDLIFSEPSNPWVSGVSSLFTTEFYGHVSRHLAPGGIFGQWLHLYDMNDGLVLSVLAALHQHFPAYEVFLADRSDIVVVASNATVLPPPDWDLLLRPEVARDLCHMVPLNRQALEGARLTHRAALAPLLDDWRQPNSDFYPVLDLGAERARYLGQLASGFADFPSERFEITAPAFGRRVGPGTEASVPVSSIPRVQMLALGAAMRSPALRRAVDSAAAPRALAAAGYRLAQWEAVLNGPAPDDWHLWLELFRMSERDWHGGTSGYVDAAWYDRVERFLDRHHAPAEVRNVVAFTRALAGWDFPAAVRAADSLAPTVVAGQEWIGPDELIEGGVAAKLLTGDAAGAEELRRMLAGRRRRWVGDLRGRLIDAYLTAVTERQ